MVQVKRKKSSTRRKEEGLKKKLGNRLKPKTNYNKIVEQGNEVSFSRKLRSPATSKKAIGCAYQSQYGGNRSKSDAVRLRRGEEGLCREKRVREEVLQRGRGGAL